MYKNFKGVQALKGVSATFFDGEIHGLVGENGAGKSTLMKVISGMYPPSQGTIEFDGKTIEFKNPREAYSAGIRIVHQELSLINSLTVAENIFIHTLKEGRFTKLVDRIDLQRKAVSLLQEWNIDVNVMQKVNKLSMGMRQLVEIARELSTGGKVIILDEPTSSLTVSEIEKLFSVLLKLKEAGLVIIFISHRLNEVTKIVDRISILRDGEIIGSAITSNLNSQQICKMIAGNDFNNLYPKIPTEITTNALQVENFNGKGFRDINLQVRWGEIIGLAGLVGAGRSELCRGIFGVDPIENGKLIMDGKQISIRCPSDAVKHGIALLGEDRASEGIFPEMSVSLNIIILKIKNALKNLVLQDTLISKISKEMGTKLNIVSFNPEKQKISQLSGGNQQKVLFARLLATDPRILILDEPARGVDVHNKTEIHKIIGQFVKQNGAAIIVSSELDEVIGLCDRIYVLHEGDLVAEYGREEFNKEKILKSMMGLEK
jgi:ribose transport system ATP-binding protein